MFRRLWERVRPSGLCPHELSQSSCWQCNPLTIEDDTLTFFRDRDEYTRFTGQMLAACTPSAEHLSRDERRVFESVEEIDLDTLPVGAVVQMYSDPKNPQTPSSPWTIQKVSDGVLMWFVDPEDRGGLRLPTKGMLVRKPQRSGGLGWMKTSRVKVGDNVLFPYFYYDETGAVEAPSDFWADVVGTIMIAE